jgi:hypothetical protein
VATSHQSLPPRSRSSGSITRLPPVRLASREELTAAARVAPLLRVARDLAAWTGPDRPVTAGGDLTPADAAAAAGALDVSAEELRAAWGIATRTGMVAVSGHRAGPGKRFGVLESGRPDEALATWCEAAAAVLSQENLDGLATALYTAGRPVRLDALFEAYAAAVGALTVSAPDGPGGAEEGKIIPNGPDAGRAAGTGSARGTPEAEIAPAFSPAFSPGLEPGLELLADLGVVELGAD